MKLNLKNIAASHEKSLLNMIWAWIIHHAHLTHEKDIFVCEKVGDTFYGDNKSDNFPHDGLFLKLKKGFVVPFSN